MLLWGAHPWAMSFVHTYMHAFGKTYNWLGIAITMQGHIQDFSKLFSE